MWGWRELLILLAGLVVLAVLIAVIYAAASSSSWSNVQSQVLAGTRRTRTFGEQDVLEVQREKAGEGGEEQREEEKVLEIHNDLRRLNGLPELSWNDELAAKARAWAEKLAAKGEPIRHPVQNTAEDEEFLETGRDGQNLAEFSHRGAPVEGLELGSPVQGALLWADECCDYDPARPDAKGVGHFTQMLWKDTREVGCGSAASSRPRRQAQIFACHYRGSGNWLTAEGGLDHYVRNLPARPRCLRPCPRSRRSRPS